MKKSLILHDSFEIGILLKGVEAATEILSSAVLFFVTPMSINKFVVALSAAELSEDPNDFFFTHVLNFTNHFTVGSESFIAFYLLWHGVVKLFIVGSLWKGKLWAYPVGIAFFVIFILYQMYRYMFTRSPWLIVLTVLDLVIIFLTWVEYRRISLVRKDTALSQ